MSGNPYDTFFASLRMGHVKSRSNMVPLMLNKHMKDPGNFWKCLSVWVCQNPDMEDVIRKKMMTEFKILCSQKGNERITIDATTTNRPLRALALCFDCLNRVNHQIKDLDRFFIFANKFIAVNQSTPEVYQYLPILYLFSDIYDCDIYLYDLLNGDPPKVGLRPLCAPIIGRERDVDLLTSSLDSEEFDSLQNATPRNMYLLKIKRPDQAPEFCLLSEKNEVSFRKPRWDITTFTIMVYHTDSDRLDDSMEQELSVDRGIDAMTLVRSKVYQYNTVYSKITDDVICNITRNKSLPIYLKKFFVFVVMLSNVTGLLKCKLIKRCSNRQFSYSFMVADLGYDMEEFDMQNILVTEADDETQALQNVTLETNIRRIITTSSSF